MSSLGQFHLEQVAEDQTFALEPTELRYIALVPISNYGGPSSRSTRIEVYEAGAPSDTSQEGGQRDRGKERGPAGGDARRRGATRPPEGAAVASGELTDFSPKKVRAAAARRWTISSTRSEQFDLVPVIYHLYGSYLNNLVATTLTNRNDQPAKLRWRRLSPTIPRRRSIR